MWALKSNNLSLNDADDMAQNHSLWRLTSKFGSIHPEWCMPQKNNKKKFKLMSMTLSIMS